MNQQERDQLIKNWMTQGEKVKAKWSEDFVEQLDSASISDKIAQLQDLRNTFMVLISIEEKDVAILEFLNDLVESFTRLLVFKTQDVTGNLHDHNLHKA